jgi:hypothetical protein
MWKKLITPYFIFVVIKRDGFNKRLNLTNVYSILKNIYINVTNFLKHFVAFFLLFF